MELEFTLADRQILPINLGKFGVVVNELEAAGLQSMGYHVVSLPVPSRRKKNDVIQYHFEVYITAKDIHEKTFDIAMLEISGHADELVITGHPWKVGERSGVKAYAKRSEEHTSELQSHVNLVCRL